MRRLVSLVGSLVLVGAGAAAVASPATASGSAPRPAAQKSVTSPYVALGDSYSSGAGISPFVPGSPATCSRSQLNYSEDIAKALEPARYTDATCSGAKTQDFFSSQAAGVPPQLKAVKHNTRLVTMTIGGNDEDVFSSSFFGCVQVDAGHPDGNPCQQRFGNTFTRTIRQQTYPNLVRALSAVRAKAPRATVVILGYPRILPDQGSAECYALMGISSGDVPWLVHEQKVLNHVVQRAAAATGAVFVGTFGHSNGHDACSGATNRWMEPVVGPVNAYPVHPNAKGEAAMARATLAALKG